MTSFCFPSSGCEDAGAFIRRDAAEVVYVLIYYKAFSFSSLDADFGRAGGQSEEEVMRELAFELVAPGNVTKGLLRPEGKAVSPKHTVLVLYRTSIAAVSEVSPAFLGGRDVFEALHSS